MGICQSKISKTTSTQKSSDGAPASDLTDKIAGLSDQCCDTGRFADVYKCQYRSNGGTMLVAVKVLLPESNKGKDKAELSKSMKREVGIWKKLIHPNIVPFLGIVHGFKAFDNASLVSLWMPNETLHTFLQKNGDHLTNAHRFQLLLDISNAIVYLHSFPIVHGDLTSKNVLIDGDYTARLVDFGLSSFLGDLPEDSGYLRISTTKPGAIRWAAPECFSLDDTPPTSTTKSDIYSLGSLAYFVLSGEPPWSKLRYDAAVLSRLCTKQKPSRPTSRPIQDAHWALIERCWSSMDERPPATDVVSSIVDFLSPYPAPHRLSCDILCGIQSTTNQDSIPFDTQHNTLLDAETTRKGQIISTPRADGGAHDARASSSSSTMQRGVSHAPLYERYYDVSSTLEHQLVSTTPFYELSVSAQSMSPFYSPCFDPPYF